MVPCVREPKNVGHTEVPAGLKVHWNGSGAVRRVESRSRKKRLAVPPLDGASGTCKTPLSLILIMCAALSGIFSITVRGGKEEND